MLSFFRLSMTQPKVVILCGGYGTRLKEQTEYIPKPLVKVGDKPILCHIMKIYSHQGFNDFVLCLGYKGEAIKDYFLNRGMMEGDFSLDLKTNEIKQHSLSSVEDWKITFAETGLETETGERIKKAAKYTDGDYFLATYGDGVSDVDINKLVAYHKKMGKIATITGVHQSSKYGQLKVDNGIAKSFKQKPKLEDLVNGGFMVLQKEFIDYLENGKPIEEPFDALAKKEQLAVYEHTGVWYCMDTQRDVDELNKIWKSGEKTWKIWK